MVNAWPGQPQYNSAECPTWTPSYHLSLLWVWGSGIGRQGCFYKSLLRNWRNESVNNLVPHWSFSLCLFADCWDICPHRRLYPYREGSRALMLCGVPSNLWWMCFPLNIHVWASCTMRMSLITLRFALLLSWIWRILKSSAFTVINGNKTFWVKILMRLRPRWKSEEGHNEEVKKG